MLGMKIIESPLIQPIPRLQLSHNFNACSDRFTADMNAWLKERFGTYMPTYVIGGSTLVVSPEHMSMLRNIGETK